MGKSLSKNEKFFISELKRYVKYFNLLNWELEIISDKSDGYRAFCKFLLENDNSYSGRIVTVVYDIEWINQKDIGFKEISEVAFHETMEILLAELSNYGYYPNRHVTHAQVYTETHNVIRILENTIFKDFLESKVNNKKEKKNPKLKRVKGK